MEDKVAEKMARAKQFLDSGEMNQAQYDQATRLINQRWGAPVEPVAPVNPTGDDTVVPGDAVPGPNGPAVQAGGESATSAPLNPGVVDLSTTQTQSSSMRPEDEATMIANTEAQAQGIERIGKAEEANAVLDAAEKEVINTKRATDLADELALRQAENDKLKAQEDEYLGKIAEASNMKIDSGRFFNSRSTGDKVLAGFSVLLGGLSNGLAGKPGAPNPALDIIDKAIDRDIREQEANIGNAQKAAEMQGTVYQRVLSATNDKRVAREATRAATYEQLAAKADIAAQRAKAPLIAEKAVLQANQLRAQADASRASMNKIVTTKTVEQKAVAAKGKTAATQTMLDNLANKESAIKHYEELAKTVKGQGLIQNKYNQIQKAIGTLDADTWADDGKVQSVINSYIQEMTGAALGVQEAVRLANAFVDRSMPPEVFKRRLDDIVADEKRKLEGLRHAYGHSYDLPESRISPVKYK